MPTPIRVDRRRKSAVTEAGGTRETERRSEWDGEQTEERSSDPDRRFGTPRQPALCYRQQRRSRGRVGCR